MEQTKQTFAYRQKRDFSDFYAAIAFGVAAAGCGYFHYGIRIGSLRVLAYPNSVYVFGGLALIALVYALVKLSKTNKSKKNGHPIAVGASSFSFPHKGGKVEVAVSEIENAERHSDEDDGDSLIVWAKGKRYEFFEVYFETEAKYAAFVELIEEIRKA
jgi:hypothetical protein